MCEICQKMFVGAVNCGNEHSPPTEPVQFMFGLFLKISQRFILAINHLNDSNHIFIRKL